MPPFQSNNNRSSEFQGAFVSTEQKQKTISELFATSKSFSIARPNTLDLQDPAPRKRIKYTHQASSTEESLCPTAAMNNVQSASSIGSTGNNAAELIDLTGSPGPAPSKSSPSRKRLSGSIRPTSFAPTGGPKKLLVRNLRTIPKTDPNQYYNHVSNQLETALSAIFTGLKLPCSLEELYKGVESLCKQNRAPAIYKMLQEKCRKHVSVQTLEPLSQRSATATATNLLELVVKEWSMWRTQLVSSSPIIYEDLPQPPQTTIRSIFYYLDRSYLLQTPALESIEEMGINGFRNYIYANGSLKEKILQGTYDLLAADRKQELYAEPKALLVESVKLLHALGVYTKDFGPKVIGDSEEYLLSWASQKSSSLSLPCYVSECHKLVESETKRCDRFGLDRTTKDTLEIHIEVSVS